ncbi:unnamed protein product [Oikopleura dioica]|uniref:Autophagy-related protein n=1 Tax=Oikopleura dioica TaxID=34765 RepID=E4YTJ0_OIKDI|nr:unnamed protein product [Oikopleura dioica]
MRSEFKNRKTFEDRARDSAAIRDQHTNKVPVIVERWGGHRQKKKRQITKFLVPDHVTVTELVRVLRRRLNLAPGQAFFLLSDRGLPPGTQTLAELWESEHDEDGFLYVFYAAQEYFG